MPEASSQQPKQQTPSQLYAEGRYREALRAAEPIIAAEKNTDILNIAAASAVMLGMDAQAEQYWKQALAIKPGFYPACFSLGFLCARQGRAQDAEIFYLKALSINPDYAEACCNLGNLYTDLGRVGDAEIYYRKAVALKPDFASAQGNLGVHYMKAKKYREAEECYRKALAIQPDYIFARNNYGRLCADLKRMDEAEQHYRAALAIDPAFADALFNFANLLATTNRVEQAEAAYRKLLSLRPDYADAYANLGNLLKDQYRFEEAETCYHKVLNFRPGSVEVYSTLGGLYMKMKRFVEAEGYDRKALAIQPDHAKTMLNLAFLLLSQGRFEEGWRMYEARYRFDPNSDGPVSFAPALAFPQWRGEPVAGKSLVVWHEQGFGDIIQFARYVGILKRQGARHITCMCKEPLRELLQALDGVDRVLRLDEQAALGPQDFWTFPLSIPLYCKTRLDTIPSKPGYLSVPETARKKWRGRISQAGMKVGLVWKGSTAHREDAERSLPGIEALRPLWDVPGVCFVSLQKEQGGSLPADQPLLDLGNEIENFADAAAIIEQLDLVICVDTAIAHLAGALGKPVWVLTKFVPDWRWMMDREDSPWYPSLRLFRQQTRGDWSAVVTRVKAELEKAGINATQALEQARHKPS